MTYKRGLGVLLHEQRLPGMPSGIVLRRWKRPAGDVLVRILARHVRTRRHAHTVAGRCRAPIALRVLSAVVLALRITRP